MKGTEIKEKEARRGEKDSKGNGEDEKKKRRGKKKVR